MATLLNYKFRPPSSSELEMFRKSLVTTTKYDQNDEMSLFNHVRLVACLHSSCHSVSEIIFQPK